MPASPCKAVDGIGHLQYGSGIDSSPGGAFLRLRQLDAEPLVPEPDNAGGGKWLW